MDRMLEIEVPVPGSMERMGFSESSTPAAGSARDAES